MAAQPPPLVVPSYYQLVVPGSNLPTAGIPGDTDEAGNILGADTSGIIATPVARMAEKLTVLPNRGSVCFRNAVLHSLFSLDRFVQLLRVVEGLLDGENRPIFRQLHDLAVRFRAGDPTVGAIAAVDAVWTTITQTQAHPATPVINPAATNPFGGQRVAQEDAVEFLEYLLYRLTATEIPVDYFDFDASNRAYRQLFGFQRATRTAYDCACPQKHRKPILLNGANPSPWTQAEYTLHVVRNPAIGATTLSNAIPRAMYATADGANESELCPTCGEGQVTGRFSKFFYLPDILSIAITHQRTRKNAHGVRQTVLDFDNKIDYQERLDLSNLCERPADQGNAVYRLKAVVVWQGGETTGQGQQGSTGGHYYTYLRRETEAGVYWQRLNEQTNPTSVDLNGGLEALRQDKNQPRLLFYEKEQQQPGAPPAAPVVVSSTGGQDGDGAGATTDPPADATYEPYITTYRVQWKPCGNAPASTATPGCCSGGHNNTGGDHPDETGGSPVSLRGGGDGSDSGGDGSDSGGDGSDSGGDGSDSGGDGSDSGGDGSDSGDDDGLYAGFENWTDVAQFRNAFATEGLLLLDNGSTLDDWRNILREHLTPTRAVQYDVYSIQGLRRIITARGLGTRSRYRQVLEDALTADDAANGSPAQTPSPDNATPAQTPPPDNATPAKTPPPDNATPAKTPPPDNATPAKTPPPDNATPAKTPPPVNATPVLPPVNATPVPPPVNATPVLPPVNATPVPPPVNATPVPPPVNATPVPPPVNATPVPPPVNTTPVPHGDIPVVQDPDTPDPALEARLQQLENLIASLEDTNRPCNCPLNGQLPGDQTCQNSSGNQAQPCRNRGLHIRLTPSGGSQDLGSRDYWVPLAPQQDHDNLNLRVSIQVSERTSEGLYPVRFSFSGPQPPEGGLPVLPRDAPFRNTIRFKLPFYIYPQNLHFEMWQENIPDAALLDTRRIDVTFQPPSSAGRTRTAAEAGLDEGGSPPQIPKTG